MAAKLSLFETTQNRPDLLTDTFKRSKAENQLAATQSDNAHEIKRLQGQLDRRTQLAEASEAGESLLARHSRLIELMIELRKEMKEAGVDAPNESDGIDADSGAARPASV